jgi:hypothetical protein
MQMVKSASFKLIFSLSLLAVPTLTWAGPTVTSKPRPAPRDAVEIGRTKETYKEQENKATDLPYREFPKYTRAETDWFIDQIIFKNETSGNVWYNRPDPFHPTFEKLAIPGYENARFEKVGSIENPIYINYESNSPFYRPSIKWLDGRAPRANSAISMLDKKSNFSILRKIRKSWEKELISGKHSLEDISKLFAARIGETIIIFGHINGKTDSFDIVDGSGKITSSIKVSDIRSQANASYVNVIFVGCSTVMSTKDIGNIRNISSDRLPDILTKMRDAHSHADYYTALSSRESPVVLFPDVLIKNLLKEHKRDKQEPIYTVVDGEIKTSAYITYADPAPMNPNFSLVDGDAELDPKGVNNESDAGTSAGVDSCDIGAIVIGIGIFVFLTNLLVKALTNIAFYCSLTYGRLFRLKRFMLRFVSGVDENGVSTGAVDDEEFETPFARKVLYLFSCAGLISSFDEYNLVVGFASAGVLIVCILSSVGIYCRNSLKEVRGGR